MGMVHSPWMRIKCPQSMLIKQHIQVLKPAPLFIICIFHVLSNMFSYAIGNTSVAYHAKLLCGKPERSKLNIFRKLNLIFLTEK